MWVQDDPSDWPNAPRASIGIRGRAEGQRQKCALGLEQVNLVDVTSFESTKENTHDSALNISYRFDGN